MISAGISASVDQAVTHRFAAAPPEPKPRGFTPSVDLERRATCTCGWKASGNSRDSGAATDLWAREHRAPLGGAA